MAVQLSFIEKGESKPQGFDLVLEKDDWDDQGYKTKYRVYMPKDGYFFRIGSIKISSAEMASSRSKTEISGTLSSLDDGYFSLGQSENFFKNIYSQDPLFAQDVLTALKEVVSD